MKHILIIEDDPAIRMGLEASLAEEGYALATAAEGNEGLRKAMEPAHDLILLDIMLPGKNGMDICRELRAAGVSTIVMMLTSKSDEIDKVLGLETGADAYVTKPFSMRELKAQIKALFRRTQEMKKGVEEVTLGDLHIDFTKQIASKKDTPVKFSPKEMQVLKFFIEHEGAAVTRDTLLNEIWGYEHFPTTRTIDNFILSIRKKIEDNPSAPRYLITVHTAGYRFIR